MVMYCANACVNGATARLIVLPADMCVHGTPDIATAAFLAVAAKRVMADNSTYLLMHPVTTLNACSAALGGCSWRGPVQWQ